LQVIRKEYMVALSRHHSPLVYSVYNF
jgi:hypothetical protein